MSLCFLWVCHSLRQIVHCFTRSWLIQLEKKKEQVKRSGAVTEAGRGIRPYIVWRSSLTSTDFTESFTAWAKHGTRLNTVSFFISSCKIIFIVSSSCLKQCSNTINLSGLSVAVVWKREPWVSYVWHSGELPTHGAAMSFGYARWARRKPCCWKWSTIKTNIRK